VHKDALADLGAVRDELMDVERDITRLEELDALVKAKPGAAARAGAAPSAKSPEQRKTPIDELAFLKSVTEDDKNAPSPRRASGAQFQPVEPDNATPVAPANADAEVEKTLKCRECGTMNTATEWYCENCGAELAAM
jgi:rubredoxin